jgi:FkbM family methyltransferase
VKKQGPAGLSLSAVMASQRAATSKVRTAIGAMAGLLRWRYLFWLPPTLSGIIIISPGYFMNALEKKIRKIIHRNYGARSRLKVYRRLGLVLLLNYANYIDRRLIIKEPYEQEQLAFFKASLQQGNFDLFVDVGANIGLYSLLAAGSGKVADILAFEPDLRNNYQFRANILLNDFVNLIQVRDVGLSNETGGVEFLQQQGSSTGKSRIGKTAPVTTKAKDYRKITIPISRFDDDFQYQGRHIFVKMDVEGHELLALQGMERLLAENSCLLQVEVFAENLAAVEELMTGQGYSKFQEIGDDRFFKNF